MTEGNDSTIVVINDDQAQLHLTAALLERAGYRVVRFSAPEEALDALAQISPVHLIVTDLHMPQLDGWRLCRLLRSPIYARLNRVPILVLSATFSGADAEEITLDLGANGFLPIPYDATTFLGCVRKLLSGQAPSARVRVLIVSGDPVETANMARAVEAAGWSASVASSVQDAAQLLRERSFDTAILDYDLRELGDDGLLRHIKGPGSGTVVICLARDIAGSWALTRMKQGADGYLHKPCEGEHLVALCEKARRERALLRVEELLELRTQQLRQADAQLLHVLESLPDMVLVHDEQGVILHVNETVARQLGWPAQALCGRSMETIEDCEGRGQVSGGTEDQPVETVYVTSRGERLPVEVRERPIVFEGRSAVLTVARDVSQRKQAEAERATLEEQLRHTQKMEAIGELAGGIAHDVNNLLMVIGGHAELLKGRVPQDEPVMRSVSAIQAAVERGKQLTEQLLGFARRGQHQRVPVDIHRVIQDITFVLAETIDRRIRIETNFEASQFQVLGDPSQLEQVVLNLALNARDAMLEGGRLEFRTHIVTVEAHTSRPAELSPGRYLVLRVSDTGIGIRPEIRSRIFEPFFTTKERSKSSGMGLAMVYGIVKNHGGAIEVESVVGQGTTMCVWLPVADETGSTATLQPEPPMAERSPCILVVDDEPMVREVAAELLRQLGYVVEVAVDGQEAVDRYRGRPGTFDVVLLDLVMPRLSGLDCFRALQAIDPQVRVLVCTGYERDRVAQSLLDMGAKGLIRKPYTLAELGRAVREVLGHIPP